MAAYSTLVTLSKAIDQILPYEQHYSFLCSKHQMQSLHHKVTRFQVFLEEISGKSSDGVDELESRIRNVACRLEDIVEPILVYSLAVEHQIEVNSRLLAAEGMAKSRKSFFRGLVNKLCVPCCRSTIKDGSGSAEAYPSLREDSSVEMKKILSPGAMDTKAAHESIGHESTVPSTSAEAETETSLDDILGWCLDQDLENKAKYSHLPLTEGVAAAFGNSVEEAGLLLEETMEMKKILDNRVVIARTSISSHNIATPILSGGAPDTDNTTVGLKDVLKQILDQITNGQRALEVIPITGMGGIGKTTLARAVYDHHGKQARFDLVLWATVSQQYDVKEILRSLVPVDAEEKEPNKTLIELVYQRLFNRRYLIIIDDVWEEKVWDGVSNAFPTNNNYSRVILTTRLANVATYVSSSSTCAHQMKLLSEDQSWDLLRDTVCGPEIGCPSKFEYFIGRRISGNCKGLPLALVVIGGLLKLNNAEDHWEHVATSTTAEAAADDDSFLRILSLSYTNLPPYLKACFLYFGMFREDKEIPTKELVRLWCAEGFLKPRGSKTMEEVGEECLEELVERNLVLVMKKKYDGKIKTSSIHDVLRDLSLRQAHAEKFLYRHHGSSWEIDEGTFRSIIKDQPRRISFPQFILESSISCSSPIRTFRTDWCSGVIPEFKLLRVLGSVQFSYSALRNSVRLNNLRYLHLYKKWGDEESITVPKSISKLRNLETLFVSSSDEKYDFILPVEIWEMPRLRHLVVEEDVNMKLAPFPAYEDSSIDSCSSLQTLTGLLNFDFTPCVIQKLQQNLNKLQIKYDTIFSGDWKKKFVLENLVNLHHLESLTISRGYFKAPKVRTIGFPINLKKLSLRGTWLPWEKMTSIGDLIHLEVLKLGFQSFYGKVWEPIEGGFPQLKYLKMEYVHELEEWGAESTHFPSLEKLLILECINLKEVPGEIGDIDTLQKLIVKKAKDGKVWEPIEGGFPQLKYLKMEMLTLEEWRAESTHFPSLEKLVILECEKLKEVPYEIGDIDTLEKLIVKKWDDNDVGRGFEESVRRIEEESVRVGNDSLQVFILMENQYFNKGEIRNK